MSYFWTAKFTLSFKRGYKKLTKNIRQRVEIAVEDLLASDDPRKKGHILHGPWRGCYSYEVGLKYRLVFRVDTERKEIEFLAVGTHKIY